MKAILYKTLSNEQEITTVAAGQTVEKAFPKTNFENAVIIVNGKKQGKDYLLKESDIVTIRELPAHVVLGIVAIAFAIGAGIVAGVSLYKAKLAAEEAKKELDKVKKLTNKQDIDNRPFLRGASNTLAKNNSQPYICGRHLFTPYLLCNPFYKLAGSDGASQYTYTVLECGFNRQILQQIAIDDITIKTFQNPPAPQEGYYQLDGGQVFAEDGLIEISQDGGLLGALPELNYRVVSASCNSEIPRDSKVAAGDASYLSYSLDAYAKNVDIAISFPYGLYAYNDDNDKIATQVTITPQYSLNNGASWIDFTFDNNGTATNTFYRLVSSKEMRFNAHKEFTLADYAALKNGGHKNILIRLRSNGNDDSKIKNDCYCLYYQSQCFDPNKSSYPAGIISDGGAAGLVPCKIVEDRERAYCTILGLRVKATHNNEDKLKKINVITQGTARTWNGAQWSGGKSATRNPAAWALEILTSDSHPMSKFADSEIDLQSFGDFYEYCEENEFRFDHVITQNAKKGDTLNTIMENCGAVLYWDMYGRLAVAIDRPQENAVAVYNPQNIIGDPQNKKSFGRRTDGLRIKYITSYEDLYTEETYLLMREENGEALTLNEDSTIKDVTVTGITEHEHVVKYARRLMAVEALRPKTTTIEIGKEGVYYTPYSKILLQDDSLKIGTGNGAITNTVWQNGYLAKIQINEYVTFESGKRYGVIVNCYGDNKAVPIALKVTGSGYTDTMTVTTQVADSAAVKPEIGCVLSFGELDENGDFVKITTPYVISNTKRTDKGFSLELVNYNEAIYDSGTIPDYVSNITQKPQGSGDEIPPDYVTTDKLHEVIDDMQSGNIPVGKPDAPYNVRAYALEDRIVLNCDAWGDGLRNELKSIAWILTKADGETTATVKTRGNTGEYIFDRVADGYPEAAELAQWKIVATSENVYGKRSDPSEERPVNTELYGTWHLDAPAVTVRESARVVSLSFAQTARADGRKRYGIIKHKIQIKRLTPPADEEFYKPAQSANPWESEENYKDGAGFVEAGDTYAQTLPLLGQSQNLPIDTTYCFSVTAFNEAGESAETIVNGVARGTNIKDIVENAIGTAQVREDAITADKIFVKMLSAIQENIGYITGGTFEGNEHNRWALSNVTLPDGSIRYEGAMRVGGENEYFEVEPYNIVNGVPQDYHVRFKAGNFEITSQTSNINGILYIMKDSAALDRTKISPNGTYYQHRETVNDEWQTVAGSNVNGVQTPQVFSEDTLYITNQDMAQRRKEGYDIGNPYLSEQSRVYHFDTDVFDQNGNNDLTITDAEAGGSHHLVGADIENDDIDFTPAILAIAPYATIGKSLYGRYGIRTSAEACAVFTVDFWLQYIYAENQVIFNIGNTADKIKMIIASAECYLEKGISGGESCPFNEETNASRLYIQLLGAKCLLNDAADNCPFNEPEDGEARLNATAEKPFKSGGRYYTASTDGGVETFTLQETTAANYYELVEAGLYEKTIPLNQPDGAHNYLQHEGQTATETTELSELGVSFEPNSWLHIGIIANEEKIYVALNDRHTDFDRYASVAAALQVELNSGLNSFMLDELLIDNTAAEELATFYEHTQNRVPWAKLPKSENYFVLTVSDLANFKTNIFDTSVFREKVTAIVQDFINNS